MTPADFSLSTAYADFESEVATMAAQLAGSEWCLASAFPTAFWRAEGATSGYDFFRPLFALFRMPPARRDLYDAFLKLRRFISDGLILRDVIDPEISIVRRLVCTFRRQFPLSRGVFANSFSDLFFGSVELGQWEFPDDDDRMEGYKRHFPRLITYEGADFRKLIGEGRHIKEISLDRSSMSVK
jgi:hypothetical protein